MDCELLAPAGNLDTALAAFNAGADAVYCGLTDFSARAFADNFSFDDLKKLLRVAHAQSRRVYVTFNTVIDEDAIDGAIEQLSRLDEVRPDALIVQDLGVARVCRQYFPDLELHASTQLVAHNLEGVLALGELGFRRVVLARELSLEEITSIAKRCGDIELECFIHGALCYSLSGLCLFGAMEKGRSGNRGKCPYCCREGRDEVKGEGQVQERKVCYPFSMKDLRLGEDARKLAEAGVASLKIEGRMKSSLYVASVTKYYRQILGERSEVGGQRSDSGRARVSVSDLETVFSRRTTELYFNGRFQPASPIDPTSLGHTGTLIGTVKRITKDREGLSWLRFHTMRGLEKHDGLQFEAMVDGRHVGMGVVEMRQAISRRPVFEVNAGVDVEVLVPAAKAGEADLTQVLKPGMKIFCSMSNAVKRMFPAPSFRPSDYPGDVKIDVKVTLTSAGVKAEVAWGSDILVAASESCREDCRGGTSRGSDIPVAASEERLVSVQIDCALEAAKNPAKTAEGVRKAFLKLGETDYRLGTLTVIDDEKRFVPMSALNDLRRDLVEKLDASREATRQAKLSAALADEGRLQGSSLRGSFLRGSDIPVAASESCRSGLSSSDKNVAAPINAAQSGIAGISSSDKNVAAPNSAAPNSAAPNVAAPIAKTLKLRAGQTLPAGAWDEVIVAIEADTELAVVSSLQSDNLRLALPVYTAEPEFNKLRSAVKRFLRAGYAKWEASDLATLRMLKQCGVTDVTADWTLYAFNSRALATVFGLGVKRVVASPENTRENLQYLAESGYAVEFLTQQATPLFMSLTQPQGIASHAATGMSLPQVAALETMGDLAVYRRGALWVTTRRVPRTFEVPEGGATRLDLSWDPPV